MVVRPISEQQAHGLLHHSEAYIALWHPVVGHHLQIIWFGGGWVFIHLQTHYPSNTNFWKIQQMWKIEPYKRKHKDRLDMHLNLSTKALVATKRINKIMCLIIRRVEQWLSLLSNYMLTMFTYSPFLDIKKNCLWSIYPSKAGLPLHWKVFDSTSIYPSIFYL